jgi:hypothetical protein
MRKIGILSLPAALALACAVSAAVRPPTIESPNWLNTPGGRAPVLVDRPVLVEFWTFW